MTRQDALKPDGATGQRWRWLWTLSLWIVLSCFTALVFVISLAVTMPASALRSFITMPPQITDLQGTIWQGAARLQDGYVLRWDGQFGALILARVSVNVTLTGEDSLLSGTVGINPWMMSLRDLAGPAGPGLLALAPGLPLDRCTSRAVVDVPLIRFGRGQAAAEGRIDIAAGDCTDFAGTTIPVPALTLTLHSEGNNAVADLADGQSALAQVIVAGDRRLFIRVEPAGAALIPGMPTSGRTEIEYPF